jgi:hypothetical protein
MLSAKAVFEEIYCHEELLRLAAAGHADTIRRVLRATALAEIAGRPKRQWPCIKGGRDLPG